MKLKGLILPGYACTSQIWEQLRKTFETDFEITWVDYPHTMTASLNTISDYADWLRSIHTKGEFDFIIGHSMGGLIALDLAIKEKAFRRKIILVETFLVSPNPFFQNLFLPTTSKKISKPTIDMLDREKPKYTHRLKECLQDLVVHLPPAQADMSIHALYGNRGSGDKTLVLRELGWDVEFSKYIDVTIIQNACHFPMVENPTETARVLKEIIG